MLFNAIFWIVCDVRRRMKENNTYDIRLTVLPTNLKEQEKPKIVVSDEELFARMADSKMDVTYNKGK